jgi:hypothetical protein
VKLLGPREVIVAQIYPEREQTNLREFIVSAIGGDHPTRLQRAIRPLMLLVLFELLAVPVIFDLFLK